MLRKSGLAAARVRRYSWEVKEVILRYFAYAHLPEHLQAVSAPFHALALQIVNEIPRNPERTVALRKLLESKDAAVRAALPD